MRASFLTIFSFVILVLLGLTYGTSQSKSDKSKKALTYTADIAPISKAYCLPCHLEENENPSGLALDNYELLMKGGNHGNTVVPGKPQESNLYLKQFPNPPFGKQMARNKKKLTEEELKTIYSWIEQGAKK